MASKVVFIEPDPFAGNLKTLAKEAYVPRPYALKNIDYVEKELDVSDGNLVYNSKFNRTLTASRPLSGIVVKPNTHATVQVRTAEGNVIKVFNRLGRETDDNVTFSKPPDGSTPNDDVWTDWLLQSVHEERAEKTQIVETFGETYLYAFGQRPRVLAITGILFNTQDYNWRSIFWKNWDEYFRATQLIRRNARMYIMFDDILVEGYPMNAAADQTSADQHVMSFSFSFFVTNYINLVAESNFESIRNNITQVVRAGLSADYLLPATRVGPSGAILGDASVAVNDLTTNRKPLLEALLPQTDLLYKGDSIPKQLTRAVLGNDISTTLATTINLAIGTGTGGTSFADQSMTVANNLLNSALENLSLYRNRAYTKVENTLGINNGEINTWFGFLADIIEKNTRPSVLGETSPWRGTSNASIASVTGSKIQLGLANASLKMMGIFAVPG